MPETNPAGQILVIHQEIDEDPVVGEILFQSRRGLAVRILSPYVNLTNSRHLPYFAVEYCSFVGSRGEAAARSMVVDCFRLGHFLERHLAELRDAWAAHLAAATTTRNEHHDRDESLARQKEAKAALQAGTMSQGEYQAVLARRREMKVEQMVAGRYVVRDFMDKFIPERLLKAGFEPQIIAVIEGRLQFMPTPEPPPQQP